MLRCVAYALCAVFCVVALAPAASADVTYTWETLSSVAPDNGGPGTAPAFDLSFTVAGPVSVAASDGFADNAEGLWPASPVAYPFPSDLTSFSLSDGIFGPVTLADFTSPNPLFGYPVWSFALTADPADSTASLSLFFTDSNDNYGISGSVGSGGSAQFSTGSVSTVFFGADQYLTDEPARYTGMLVASTTSQAPEPSSFWVLIAGLGMLGLVRRCGGTRHASALSRIAFLSPHRRCILPLPAAPAASRYADPATMLRRARPSRPRA
ncbi:MAG: PEP-CTERM sorting domain-containing protein [Stellaceae bacterium]